MGAELMLNERHILSEEIFIEMVVWRLPQPLPGCRHNFKYRLALIVNGSCLLRYDNEAGKGDHKHVADKEAPYAFISPEVLLEEFWRDVDCWRI